MFGVQGDSCTDFVSQTEYLGVFNFNKMKTFRQSLTDYFIEKSINPHAKLCWDSINKSYVISLYFTRQETFNKLNWEVVCQ